MTNKAYGHSFLLTAGEMARDLKSRVYVFFDSADKSRTPYRLTTDCALREGWQAWCVVEADGTVCDLAVVK